MNHMANYGYNERIIQEAITFLVENFAPLDIILSR